MTAGSRFGSLLVGLLASIVVARWLGPGGKGMLAAMGGVAGLATQVGNLGLQSALSYFAAQRPARAHGLSRLALAAAALVGLIAPAVIIALHRWLPGLFGPLSAWPLYLFLGVIPFSLAVLYCQSLLLGLEDLVGFNLVESGGRVISALVVPVWVFLDPTIVAAD